MLQKLVAFIVFVIIPFYNVKAEKAFCSESDFSTQNSTYFLHTVEKGETIYSLSRMYHVTIEDIYCLNPESRTGIKVGSQLKIPQKSDSFLHHTIQYGETLYSVSQKYHVKKEDILKANAGLSTKTFAVGKVICIPMDESTINTSLYSSTGLEKFPTIKIALLLPFGLKDETYKSATGKRMLEYYEGLLLALREMKVKGISVDLQVFDIGSKKGLLQDIFDDLSLQNVNLLIGGISDEQIRLISDFSYKYNIPYVVPFSSKNDDFLFCSNVYQINTPQPYLYAKVSTAFCRKYKNANIIFYISNRLGNRMDFVNIVQRDLDEKKITYKILESTNPLHSDIVKLLGNNKNNVFVLSDDKQDDLFELISSLKTIKDINPRISISFFGYPTWQIYSVEHANDFFNLNVSFYSIFYANPISQEVKLFRSNYYYWYSKDLINNYPKYGMLGYDMGMFFIQLLNTYGTSFVENINKSDYRGIQTGFYFERLNNQGRFINTNFYWVEFKKDFTISSFPIK